MPSFKDKKSIIESTPKWESLPTTVGPPRSNAKDAESSGRQGVATLGLPRHSAASEKAAVGCFPSFHESSGEAWITVTRVTTTPLRESTHSPPEWKCLQEWSFQDCESLSTFTRLPVPEICRRSSEKVPGQRPTSQGNNTSAERRLD